MYFREKTPKLGEGFASDVMNMFFTQIREQKGMTTFIQEHGVNGCWMKPDDLYDFRISKFFKILKIIVIFRTEDEFMEIWNAAGLKMYRQSRTASHMTGFRVTSRKRK